MRKLPQGVTEWHPMHLLGESLGKYSGGWQFGETGILVRLAEIYGVRSCCEIGAGDGDTLPVNCDPLIKSWRACQLFEMDQQKRNKLEQLYHKYSVDVLGEWTLADTLPMELAVIDVDGKDLEIALQVVECFRPKVLMVEHNDLHLHRVIQAKVDEIEIALPEYDLIGVTRCNSIYVLKGLTSYLAGS